MNESVCHTWTVLVTEIRHAYDTALFVSDVTAEVYALTKSTYAIQLV
jgi:hypothetical protein